MKRMHSVNSTLNINQNNPIYQTAFHEAGHAASIYLGNKSKDLPPVFFQIEINSPNTKNDLYAKVIDGFLIQSLPIAEIENIKILSENDQQNYICAYQADIINLLAGPLAEAKYVSILDDEPFNLNLINAHALNYYGGSSDITKAYAYLEYFVDSRNQREETMLELFSQAFQFINNRKNWQCIHNLAHHIVISDKSILSSEEVISVLCKT